MKIEFFIIYESDTRLYAKTFMFIKILFHKAEWICVYEKIFFHDRNRYEMSNRDREHDYVAD